MSVGAIAERYAQAIFELADAQNELSPVRDQLASFATAVSGSEELRSTLTNPLVPVKQRDELIKALGERLGLSALAVRSLLVIAVRGRMSNLTSIVERLSVLVDEKDGVLRASVTTATELPESYFQSLVEKIQAATPKRVVLERHVDPELIGGAVAQVGDSVLDASVLGQLRRFERQVLATLAAGTA